MEKINIAELLKDCPSGMELDCTMYEDVYFEYVDELNIIHSYIEYETHRASITFNQYGTPNSNMKSKCVIFPQGKTTWEGFQRPFKDGDIVTWKDRGSLIAFIYKERKNVAVVKHHFALYTGGLGILTDGEIALVESELVFATEEEKDKLFQAIKDNGYKWNEEIKTLEKLVKSEFKIGDKVRHKDDKNKTVITITGIKDDYYLIQYYNLNRNDYQNEKISFKDQDKYELVPDKFDINTLVPFESRVLMRSSNAREWTGTIFSHYSNNKFYGCGMCCDQCIPYKGNEHLLGATDDCDEYFKIWQ